MINNMNKTNPTIIRLSVTSEIRKALNIAKLNYPTLSDPEIIKLGLSKISTEAIREKSIADETDRQAIRRGAVYAIGEDYLQDSAEDLYSKNLRPLAK
jgi:hypothetical protein